MTFFRFSAVALALGVFCLLQASPNSSVSPVAVSPSTQSSATALAHDIKAHNLTIPVYVQGGKMTLVQSAVENVGENTESFSLEFGRLEWDSTFNVLRTKTVTDLAAGDMKTVSFGFFTFPKNIEYDYFVRAVLDGDMNPDNDVAIQAVNSFTTMRDVVVIEKGTGTWCGYCPASAVCVDSLYKVFQGQIAAIEYHAYDDYETPQGMQRISYYQIPGYPTAIFNGISEIVGGGSAYDIDKWWPKYKGKIQTAFSNHGTCLQMQTSYTESNGHIKTKTKLTGVATSYVRSFRLFYAVSESHISKHWGGLDSLQHVFRGMFPNLDGIPIIGEAHIEEGWTFDNEIEFDLPATAVKENCEIVAFVQNPGNQVIMAAAIAQPQTEATPMIAVAPADTLTLHGAPEDEFITEGKIFNLTNDPVVVRLQKIPGRVPEDWSSSICIEYCLAPWVDAVDDTIAAHDSLDFSLHLYSGAMPDSGDMALKICTLADTSAEQGPNTFRLSLSGKTSWPASVAGSEASPYSFNLVGAYPNPFNPGTTIEYSLARRSASVRLQVYSVLGRRVADYPLSGLTAGVHHHSFDGGSLAGGVYLYRVVAEQDGVSQSSGFKKFTLLK